MKTNISSKRTRLLRHVREMEAVLKGSLAEVELTCGTLRCQCHKKGPKHKGLYFSYRYGGKSHTVYIPKAAQGQARRAHGNWLKLKEVLEKLTALEVGRLRGYSKTPARLRKGKSG